MDDFTALVVAKPDSLLVKLFRTKYLIHTIEAVLPLSLTVQPDIVLVDCDSCGANAFSLCRELRSHPSLRAPKVVLFSAFLTRSQDRAHALRCGASDLLCFGLDEKALSSRLEVLKAEECPSQPVSDGAFHQHEAEYLKEACAYLVGACEKLRESNESLVGASREETGLRHRLEGQLNHSRRLESIGTLSTGIAHDFNNILSGIIGFAEIGLHLPDAPASCTKRFDAILKAANRAAHLVGAILVFSRQHEQPQTPFDVPQAVGEALELLRASIPASIRISENHFVPLPHILGERSQFQNLLTNLVINAWHAIGSAQGRISIRTDFAPPADVHFAQNPDLQHRLYVVVQVSDSGVGIAPEDVRQIFDAFFTTKAPGVGTGLGLMVVSNIVRSWGGMICVDSCVGKGTTFTLYFPPVQLSVPVIAPQEEALPLGVGQRVLFVDDEEMVGLVVSESLSSLGYDASFVSTPELAVEKLRNEQFDLVITDLSMPRMNGIELARSLWRRQPKQRMILTTGHAGKLTPEAVYSLGFAGLLLKPFKTAALASLVQKALV
jgi:signal transduction histidine kinase